jgi:hypothetical protein
MVVIQRSGSSTQAPAVEPAQLAGLWVTGYVFGGTKHHVDLSTITVTNSAVRARNYPPEPRAEAHASRWVRVEPQSAEGVDVNIVVLGSRGASTMPLSGVAPSMHRFRSSS